MEDIKISRNLEQMLISAERYALGRRTYIVSTTVDYLTMLLPKLSDWCIVVMLDDMEREFNRAERMGNTGNFGDDCDYRDWVRFRNALEVESERREKTGKQ